MDKETLINYGWIVICVLVLAVMIALAGPFGNFVADAVKSTTQGLFDTNQNALDAASVPGLTVEDQKFADTNGGSDANNNTQNGIPLQFGEKYNVLFEGQLASMVFSETGGLEMYIGDELEDSMQDGTFFYNADGIYYTDTGEIFAAFPYKVPYGTSDVIILADCALILGNPIPLHWGKTYIDEQSGNICVITGFEIRFITPSSTVQTNVIFKNYNTFSCDGGRTYGNVSEDGTTITMGNRVYVLAE